MPDKVTELTADTVFALLGGVVLVEQPKPTTKPAATPDEYKAIGADALKFSEHNVELAEAAFAGSDFRIAFRKPGEKDWTRVAMTDETILKSMVLKEIEAREQSLRDYMENLTRSYILGVLANGSD